jgi:hypothetical protein
MLPVLGRAQTGLATTDDLKVALHDVLTHNNLFDAAYVSDRLAIGLRISRPEPTDRNSAVYLGTATTNPPALYGDINYEVNVDLARQVSTAHMSFDSKICPSLKVWGFEWHLETRSGMATDGGPSYEFLSWNNGDGVSLEVTYGGLACDFELSQTVKRAIELPVSPAAPRVPATGLSRRIADLLLADLRDLSLVGRILNTEFVVGPDSRRNGLLRDWAH